MQTPTLSVQVQLSFVRIEYIFTFQIWYCELFVKKLIKGRQKALFSFLFFLAFSQLNLSWKFELTNFPFSLSKVSSVLCHYLNNLGKTVIKLVFLSVSVIWTVKYCQKLAIFKFFFFFFFFSFFFSLCYHLLHPIFSPASCTTTVFNCPPLWRKKSFTWERHDLRHSIRTAVVSACLPSLSWIHTESRKNRSKPRGNVYQAYVNSMDVQILHRRLKAKPSDKRKWISVWLTL